MPCDPELRGHVAQEWLRLGYRTGDPTEVCHSAPTAHRRARRPARAAVPVRGRGLNGAVATRGAGPRRLRGNAPVMPPVIRAARAKRPFRASGRPSRIAAPISPPTDPSFLLHGLSTVTYVSEKALRERDATAAAPGPLAPRAGPSRGSSSDERLSECEVDPPPAPRACVHEPGDAVLMERGTERCRIPVRDG